MHLLILVVILTGPVNMLEFQPNRPPTPPGPSAAPHFGGYVTFASFVKRISGLNHVNEVYDYLSSGENTTRVLSACEQVKMAADDDGTLVYIKPCQILVVGEDVMLNATEYQGRGRPVKCHLWNINCVRVRTEDAANYARMLEEKEREARYQRQREEQSQPQRAREEVQERRRNEEEAEGPVEVETVIKVNARKRGNRMLVGDEVVMSSKRTKSHERNSNSKYDMSNMKIQLLKERVFLKDKATQVELCCTGRLPTDDDDEHDGDDNRSHGSRRSRHRNEDDDYEDDEDNLNYERND